MFVKWIGAATFIIEVFGIRIACDPALSDLGTLLDFGWFKSERIISANYDKKDFDSIDICLFTHEHCDHIDSLGISSIPEKCILIANKATSRVLQKRGRNHINSMLWEDTIKIKIHEVEINIEATRTRHGEKLITSLFAGRGNGYYLVLRDDDTDSCVSIFITGDTVLSQKVKKKMPDKVDLLIPYLGMVKKNTVLGTMTMDIPMLCQMLNIVDARVVVPVHYMSFSHYTPPSEKEKTECPSAVVWLEPGMTLNLDDGEK